MDIESIQNSIKQWQREEFFDLYYRAGEYHKRALEHFQFQNLWVFRTFIIGLKPVHPLFSAEKDEEYESLKKKKSGLRNFYDSQLLWNDDLKNTAKLNYQKDLAEIDEQLQPFVDEEKKYRSSDLSFRSIERFFFFECDSEWNQDDLEDFNTFIIKVMRRASNLKKNKASLANDWELNLKLALEYEDYDLVDDSIHISYKPEVSDKFYFQFDYKVSIGTSYQLLSAYLIALRNMFRLNNYRVDEWSRIHLNMNNGIMASLEIKNLPNDNHFNEALIGKIKDSLPLSESGYDYTLYLLSYLTLNFKGYQFNFKFDAYSVLMNTNGFNVDASSKLLDDKIEEQNNY